MYLKGFKRIRKNRIVIIPSALFLVGFCLITMMNMYMSIGIFYRGMSQTVVPLTVDRVMGLVEGRYSESRSGLELIAHSMLDNGLKLNSPEELSSELEKWRALLGVRDMRFYSSENGMYYDAGGHYYPIELDPGFEQHASALLRSDEENSVIISPFHGLEGRDALSFYHDIKIADSGGNVVGVLGLGHELKTLDKEINVPNDNVTVYFVERDGRVSVPTHRYGAHALKIYDLNDPGLLLSKPGRTLYKGNIWGRGRKLLLHFRYLEFLDRTVMIEIDVTPFFESFYVQARKSLRIMLATALLVILANIVILYLSNHKLSLRAYTDPLTGCYNRSYAQKHVKKISDGPDACSILVFDIDWFKEVNDRDGHSAGDQALIDVARIAHEHLRSDDMLVRWGGDEFMAVLNTDFDNAGLIAGRIKSAVDTETGVSISIGLTAVQQGEVFDEAFDRADSALYKAKQDGRNRLCLIL